MTGAGTGRANLAILAGATAGCLACLAVASLDLPPLMRVGAAAVFALLNNTVFALMHEAVHGHFHPTRAINEFAGRWAACLFPTSFTLQRAFHLTHHHNNRSDAERFDYYARGDNVPLKILQWYGILTGLYWLSIPLFGLLYAVTGGLLDWSRVVRAQETFSRQTSASPFLEATGRVPLGRLRVEVATSLAFQLAAIWLLGLDWAGWFLCYGLFAVVWSSLQYADHAFSRLDPVEGAWNLQVSRPIRLLFLNYHFHLAHHRDPSLGWYSLPRAAGPEDPRPTYWKVLLCMWAGPRPLPGNGASRSLKDELTVNLTISAAFAAFFLALYGGSSASWTRQNGRLNVALGLDDAIPFIPWASAVYLSILVLFALSPFLLRPTERFLPLVVTGSFEVAVACVLFLAFPVVSPKVPLVEGVVAVPFGWADAINLDGNYLPSLHVALAATVAWAIGETASPAVRIVFWAWAAAIAASTVLTRQHWLLDVATGAVLAGFAIAHVHPRVARALDDTLGTLVGEPAR